MNAKLMTRNLRTRRVHAQYNTRSGVKRWGQYRSRRLAALLAMDAESVRIMDVVKPGQWATYRLYYLED